MSDRRPQALSPPVDPELEAALKKVLGIVLKDHSLKANQILSLASELQRLGVHRLVEEHLERYEKRLRKPER